MTWRPGQRASDRALEAPYDDVPDHLLHPLWDWVQSRLYDTFTGEDRTRQVAIHLRLGLEGQSTNDRLNEYVNIVNGNPAVMLDVAEALLELYGWDAARAEALRDLLDAANSAYAVSNTWRGLTMRVTPEVKDQVQAVVDAAAGSPGNHLKNAWDEAYGRKPDPVKSYSESIKAVESAMAPIVSPANLKATLGTMIRDVKAKPSKWEFVIADGNAGGVETVLNMMQLLWDGQTSRHGGIGDTRAETPDEARAAVHLAATVVQFAVGGSIALA